MKLFTLSNKNKKQKNKKNKRSKNIIQLPKSSLLKLLKDYHKLQLVFTFFTTFAKTLIKFLKTKIGVIIIILLLLLQIRYIS